MAAASTTSRARSWGIPIGITLLVLASFSYFSVGTPTREAFTSGTAPAGGTAPASGGVLAGLCEASAVLITPTGFLIGDNETEALLHSFDARLEPTGGTPLAHEVEDIEALTRTPDGALLVVGSQGANKSGEPKPLRERVLVIGGTPVRPDLSGCPACVSARALPPKEGGLSVEGAAYWGGELWLGVRSPLVDGKALLLRMEGDPRLALTVAEVVSVDLGGHGVRDLVPDGDQLVVLAGPPGGGTGGDAAPHLLYRLLDPRSAPVLDRDDLPAGSEGVALLPGGELVVVIDGDGKPGKPCRTPARWIRLPPR